MEYIEAYRSLYHPNCTSLARKYRLCDPCKPTFSESIRPPLLFLRKVHRFRTLPPSLIRLLVCDRVIKIGSAIKGDLTRLKRQFPQLSTTESFSIINLKEYAIQRGVIARKEAGALDDLVEKTLGKRLPKDNAVRKSQGWEVKDICPELLQYAALDVVASRLVFMELSLFAPRIPVLYDAPAGARVALLVQEGGKVAAYGRIAATRSKHLRNVRVEVPSKTRVVVDIEEILIPSAAATLHASSSEGREAAAPTLQELQAASEIAPIFQIVAPISHLVVDCRVSSAQIP